MRFFNIFFVASLALIFFPEDNQIKGNLIYGKANVCLRLVEKQFFVQIKQSRISHQNYRTCCRRVLRACVSRCTRTRSIITYYNINKATVRPQNEPTCCNGWSKKGDSCPIPICNPSCINGKCVKPNQCSCHHGYHGKRCEKDVDECLGKPCHQICRNLPGSFACLCKKGFKKFNLDPKSKQCVPVDSCQFTELSLVLDVSGTIYPTFYDQSLEFVTRLLSKMKITSNPNSSRVSVVTFASQSSIRIHCDKYNSSEALHDAIKKLSYTTEDSFTNIKDGLIKGHEALSSRGCGRPKAKRIMVLVTDGKANRGVGGFQAIREKAQGIRDTNTTIIAIGIGKTIKYDLLKNLTGGDGKVFTSTTFNDSKFFKLASKAMNQEQCQNKNDIDICKCQTMGKNQLPSNVEFDQTSVARFFNGSCYLEKVDNAIKKTNDQSKKFEIRNAENEECIKKLKESIKRENGDEKVESLFSLYEQCLIVDCEMKDVKSLLFQRKTFLDQESKSCAKYLRN